MRFKSFLREYVEIKEYLTDKQRARYANIKMNKDAREKTDHFFGDSDLIRENLPSDYQHDKSEVHRQIEKHLDKEISSDEYVKGVTTDKYGREARIGRMIKDKDLQNKFANDETRAGSKAGKDHYVTIVRGTEVAGQTNSEPDENHPKGHSWGNHSCKNVDSGSNRAYLRGEIENGTVVMRVHDHNDQEIYRATLHPHENESGHRVYALNSEYGVKHSSFTNHAHDVANRLSQEKTKEHTGSFYHINDDVYNDSDKDTMMHPNADKNDIDAVLKDAERHPDDLLDSEYDAMMAHKSFDTNHLEKMYKIAEKQHDISNIGLFGGGGDSSKAMKVKVLEHPKVTEKILSKALNDENWRVRVAAVTSKNATEKHIEYGMRDEDETVRTAAVSNPNISEKTLGSVFKKSGGRYVYGPYIRRLATYNGKMNSEMIDNAQNDDSESVRTEVASQQGHRMNHDQLMKAILDKDESGQPTNAGRNAIEATYRTVGDFYEDKRKVLTNKNFTKDHIDAAMATDQSSTIHAALFHPLADKSHVEKALNHVDYRVRGSALSHPLTTKEQLEHVAENDPAEHIRYAAKQKWDMRYGPKWKLQKSGEYDWIEAPKGGWTN